MNVTGPIFDYKGKEYTVQSSKECRLWLLDTAMLGGEDHRTQVHRTPLVCNEEVNFTMGIWGALAAWEDAGGTRWVLTPFWGPKHPQFKAPIEHGQAVHGAVAALYALDGASGKEIWNSGKTITASARGGLSAGAGVVYVPATDSTLYAFGFPIEK